MKVKIRVTISKKLFNQITAYIKKRFVRFKENHPYRIQILFSLLAFIITLLVLRTKIQKLIFQRITNEDTNYSSSLMSLDSYTSIEQELGENTESDVKGIYTKREDYHVRSDVGFVDLRVLTLEDFFRYYNSPLEGYSDEFIEASEKYNVVNWQLLPAIAMAETIGCQTGISYQQRNCWGWGGSGENRWKFYTFDDAIDIITSRMIEGYGNDRMNARDIQSTYCGRTCMQWGWRWAKGVDYYTQKINDFGEKYSLPRTNEITDWTWDDSYYPQ